VDEHVAAEILSAYLDAELPEPEARRVTGHVADCPSCRAHLEGLAAVAAKLQSLERLAPPPTLVVEVARQMTVARERDRLGTRLRARMETWRLEPTVGLAFALVVALALIVFGFFHNLQRWGQGTIPVLFVDRLEAEGEPADEASQEIAAVAEGPHGAEVVELAGRALVETPEGWRQLDVEGAPARVLTLEGEPWRELLVLHPELGELATLRGPVVVRVGDEILELRP
jgi:anti-sigma factor RsiW